jgi:hypothetical protein
MSRRKRNASNDTNVANVVNDDNATNVANVNDTMQLKIDDGTTNINAIDALTNVATTQRNNERDVHIAKLLHALYNDESLSSHDKKTIRRTLRDTYDYYISRERRRNASNVVASILSRDAS